MFSFYKIFCNEINRKEGGWIFFDLSLVQQASAFLAGCPKRSPKMIMGADNRFAFSPLPCQHQLQGRNNIQDISYPKMLSQALGAVVVPKHRQVITVIIIYLPRRTHRQ